MLLIEESVQACVDTLTTYLPTELAVVKAKYATGDTAAGRNIVLNIPPVKFGKPMGTGFGMPVIFCWSPDTAMAELGAAGADYGNAQYTVTTNIDVYLSNDDNEAVERVSTRFAEAINNILMRQQSLGGPALSVIPKRFLREREDQPNTRVLRVEALIRIDSTY